MYVWDEKWSLSQAVSWRSVGTPVSDKKWMFGTKNDHFLKLCHEGQLGPPASKLSALCATREVENTPKCTRLTVSLPHDPVRPCRGGGFSLVSKNIYMWMYWYSSQFWNIIIILFLSLEMLTLPWSGMVTIQTCWSYQIIELGSHHHHLNFDHQILFSICHPPPHLRQKW